MVRFETKRLTDRVTRISGINGEQMYLVTGDRRAALIDTGSGVGDLKACVETLTKLPVIVLLTHGHVDHAMGAPQFSEVYMSPHDREIYRGSMGIDARNGYLSASQKFALVEDSDYIPAVQPETFKDLLDGDVFTLGGLTVEAVACPGHSPGSMMFLLREEETLITGDACCFFTMLQGDSCLGLSSFEKNLEMANRHTKNRYTTVYMSHSALNASALLIDEVLEACELVKVGKDDKIPFEFMGTAGLVAKAYGNNGISAYARKDGKIGNLVYDPKRIWE